MDYKKPCRYCEAEVKLVKGDIIYPHLDGLHHKNFWQCSNASCGAYVGCHSGTTKPMGIVAKKELRTLRHTCHLKFDGLWKRFEVKRATAYNWIAWLCNAQADCPERLKERKTLHFGYMAEPECIYILDLINKEGIEKSLLAYK
jgi:hypothetical protein